MVGVASYRWACSEPGEHGERYIPSVRDSGSSVTTGITNGYQIVHAYRVQNLNADCYGEVTAIEFCYVYDSIGLGQPVFNWTVLIIEETNVFTITKIIAIESHPNSWSGTASCIRTIGQVECCDRVYISNFNFQTNNFVFGVTESAQGNTRNARLLGFHDVLAEYSVHTLIIPTIGQTISAGSSIMRPLVGSVRGLRMLWFVIGKFVQDNNDVY